MSGFKYTYTGDEEKDLPTHGRTVKPGDTIETDKEINHPEFKLVSGQSAKQEEKKEEKKEDKGVSL
jgi:hypothetical protein